MKVLKKFASIIIAVCLMIPVLSTVVFAADGVLMFSDPSTKVGENVSVDFVVQSSGGTIGSVDVTMSYDPKALEFVSGDGFTADGAGTLTYKGTGGGTELRTAVVFRALTVANTQISVSSSSATISSGDTLNLNNGSSAISIAAADDGTTSVEPTSAPNSPAGESTDIVVTVDGNDYHFSEAFTTTDIPEGYSETKMTFNGEERKFVANDAGVYLGFLMDDAGKGKFFLFNTEDATFAPFAQIAISDTTSLIVVDAPKSAKLPSSYQEVDMTVQEENFPAWSDPSNSRYYVIYALNTRTGEKSFYQYDTEDGTYQYFEAPKEETKKKDSESGIVAKLGEFVAENTMVVLVAAAALFLLLLILAIVFAVKLVHRNQELDDLYDEYDIPFEEEEKKLSAKSAKKGKAKDDYDDDFDDESDESEEYAEYSDEYEDEYADEYEDEYDDEYDDEDEDDYDDDEDDRPLGHHIIGFFKGLLAFIVLVLLLVVVVNFLDFFNVVPLDSGFERYYNKAPGVFDTFFPSHNFKSLIQPDETITAIDPLSDVEPTAAPSPTEVPAAEATETPSATEAPAATETPVTATEVPAATQAPDASGAATVG